MLHILVIVMLAAIAVHDAFARDGGGYARYSGGVAGWWTPLLVAVPMSVLCGLAWLACRAARKFLDRGNLRALPAAENACSAARIGAVALHVANVLVFGWMDAVRSVTGDVIVLDEVIAITPTLLVFCSTWASHWALERQARESMTVRGLDTGRLTFPMPTRRQFVIGHLRHQVLLSLVPLAMLLAWAETAERIADWLSSQKAATGLLAWLGSMASDPASRSSGMFLVQLTGLAVVLSFAPLALRFVWDTVRLSPGPLRERLEWMCRVHDVGVRELLVWRTHGAMINGAVMGLWGRLRYILLTDALLESLMRHQVEAVMAHELGHVRYRHVPWLAAVMITSMLALSLVGTLMLWGWALLAMPDSAEASMVEAVGYALGAMGLEAVVAVGLLAGTIAIFLFVSRRFEWQADAFAAMHLSMPGSLPELELPQTPHVEAATVNGASPAAPPSPPRITAGGVAAMAGALAAVSQLNHIPLDRASLRHGSLGLRISKLQRIAGLRFDALPIDATVRRIKRITLVVGVCMGLLMGAAAWWGF